MTSPNIRYFEKMAKNYLLLAWMGFLFTMSHFYMEKWTWMWVGLGITVGAIYVSVVMIREVNDQKEITRILENEKRKKIKALYGENDD